MFLFCLPTEIELSLSGANLRWHLSPPLRPGETPLRSTAKGSRIDEDQDNMSVQTAEDVISNGNISLDERGLPRGNWEGKLLGISEQDIENALAFPPAGRTPYREVFGLRPPTDGFVG